MSEERVGTLEIDERLTWQETFWVIQRVTWILMAVVVVTALLGLWGHGRLASGTIDSAESGIVVNYDRVTRHQSTGRLKINVATKLTQTETVDVAINLDWLHGISIDSIVPEPESVATTSDNAVYTFNVASPGEPVRISIEYTPVDIGRQTAQIRVADRESVSFGQFVFP